MLPLLYLILVTSATLVVTSATLVVTGALLVVTSATLVVTGALLVVTRSLLRTVAPPRRRRFLSFSVDSLRPPLRRKP